MLTLHRNSAARRGFTLVELMIVISLLAVLATLVVVYIVPSFQDNKNTIRGLDRVITALMTAKQRALRDQAPRGIRFTVTSGTYIVGQMEYAEQPDVFTGGTFTPNGGRRAAATRVNFTAGTVDFFGGADTGVTTEYEVQPGDYFRVSGVNYQIQTVRSRTQLQLTAALTTASTNALTLSPSNYQIVRQSRTISGENPVLMPNNVVIDLGVVQSNNSQVQVPNGQFPTTYGNYEILFDPAGGVMNRGGSTPIVLVIRDLTADNPVDPNSTRLLTIYPRTGMIAANPVGPASNPLQYALSGYSSGM